MQHTPSVRLPSEHKQPNWAPALIAMLVLALLVVLALQTTSHSTTVAVQASSGVYVNPELWAHRNWEAAHPVRVESLYLAQNPELVLARAYHDTVWAQAEHDFLATNPEVGLHRHFVAETEP